MTGKGDEYQPFTGTEKKFDDLLDDIGGFGRWQRVIYFLLSVSDIFGAFAILMPVLVGATPNWHCAQFEGLNSTQSRVPMTNGDNLTSAYANITDPRGLCSLDGHKCTKFVFQDDFTSIVDQWSLVCDMSFVSDMITSIQMSGLLVGAAVFGQVSDLIGRKKGFFMVFLIMIMSSFVSAFVPYWQLYAVCRAAMGFGFGGYMVIACVFPMEFLGRKYRVFVGTVGFWAIGTMILAGLGYFLREWSHLTIVTSASGLLYLFSWWIIPESPRWLMQHDRVEEAHEVLSTIARKNGNEEGAPSLEVMQRIARADKLNNVDNKKYTYWDILRVWTYCKRTLIMFLAWFTVFVLYYELSYNMKHLAGNRYFNLFLSGLVDWAAMVSVIFILNAIGRRRGMWLYLSVAASSLLGVLGIIMTNNEENYATLMLVFAMLGKAAGLSGNYNVQIYSAELFPTVVRNVGVGSGSIGGRVGSIVAPQFVYLSTIVKPAPYIICTVLCLILIPLSFCLPETNGKPLQDKYMEDDPHKKQTTHL